MSLIYKDKIITDCANAYRLASGTSTGVKAGELANKLSELLSTGSSPVITPIEITENGTYTAPDGVDGYSPIDVNVQGASLPTKGLVFENYDSDGYPTGCRFVGNWNEIPEYYAAGILRSGLKSTIINNIFKNITNIVIPEGVTDIKNSALRNSDFEYVEFPTTITSFGFAACSYTKFKSVIFAGNVPNISNYCFEGNTEILYDFSHHIGAIPSLYSKASLGHASGCVIKVPSALLSEWQNATNWVDLTDVVWEGV